MSTEEQQSIMDLSFYTGTWINTYEKARVIGSVTITEEDGKIMMAPKSSEVGYYKGEWGKSELKPHAYAPDKQDIVGFRAHFDLEGIEAFLAINENKGLLIIAGYFGLRDGEDQSDFFVREFFYKQ